MAEVKTQGAVEAMEVAEASRETEWEKPSFVGDLFLGKLNLDLIHPFPEQPAADKAEREELPAVLDYFERSVPAEGWMLGDFSLADIAASGPMVNLDHAGFALDRARYPRVADYLDRVWARPSFAAVIERERSLLARLRG